MIADDERGVVLGPDDNAPGPPITWRSKLRSGVDRLAAPLGFSRSATIGGPLTLEPGRDRFVARQLGTGRPPLL